MTLEKIQVIDDSEPWFKGKGEFQFLARVLTHDIGESLFEGYVQDDLFAQIGGVELDTFDPDDVLATYKRAFAGRVVDWLGSYGPSDTRETVEDVGNWRVWYRIEYAG